MSSSGGLELEFEPGDVVEMDFEGADFMTECGPLTTYRGSADVLTVLPHSVLVRTPSGKILRVPMPEGAGMIWK